MAPSNTRVGPVGALMSPALPPPSPDARAKPDRGNQPGKSPERTVAGVGLVQRHAEGHGLGEHHGGGSGTGP